MIEVALLILTVVIAAASVRPLSRDTRALGRALNRSRKEFVKRVRKFKKLWTEAAE